MTPFTDDPTRAPTVVFPNPGMQALSSVIHLLGVSVLGYCFARRTTFHDFTWGQFWSTITWPRLCVILVLADSWVFVFLSGVLILGSGLSHDHTSCSLGIFACILLYASSKVLTYAFLIEKVHVVWGGAHLPRLKSPVYRICLITMSTYAIILVLALLGRIAKIRSDGACIIGLKRLASLSLLVYDLYINVFLTAMFIWPLAQSKLINPRLKSAATRTLVAAFAALTTSSLNIAILTVMHGQQFGWVCLGSCGADVTVNAMVLFWVTSPTASVAAVAQSGPQPTANGTSADPNQPQSFIVPLPSPHPHRRPGSSAIMLSPVPRSPVTPNTPFAEKKYESGRPPSFVMVGDMNENRSGPGYVTIGAPPPSKKRTHGRTKTSSGVEVSHYGGSRGSLFGRMFGNNGNTRERDMEVTVTITTQLDQDEMEVGSRTSIGGASVHESTHYDQPPGAAAEP